MYIYAMSDNGGFIVMSPTIFDDFDEKNQDDQPEGQ